MECALALILVKLIRYLEVVNAKLIVLSLMEFVMETQGEIFILTKKVNSNIIKNRNQGDFSSQINYMAIFQKTSKI